MCTRIIYNFFSCKKEHFLLLDKYKILHISISVRSERTFCKCITFHCNLPCSSLFLKRWRYISFFGSRAGWQAASGVLCRLIWDSRADINGVSVTWVPIGCLGWSSCVCNVCCWTWHCSFCWWCFGWDICWDHFYLVDFSWGKKVQAILTFP